MISFHCTAWRWPTFVAETFSCALHTINSTPPNLLVVFDGIHIYLMVGFIRHATGMTHLKIPNGNLLVVPLLHSVSDVMFLFSDQFHVHLAFSSCYLHYSSHNHCSHNLNIIRWTAPIMNGGVLHSTGSLIHIWILQHAVNNDVNSNCSRLHEATGSVPTGRKRKP